MIKVEARPEVNRLDITVADPHTDEESRELVVLIRAEAAKLLPGWTAAVDLTQVAARAQFDDLSCAGGIE